MARTVAHAGALFAVRLTVPNVVPARLASSSCVRPRSSRNRTPADFAAAWREGKIEDTPQNAREAIKALALREAMQPTAAVGRR